MPLTCWTIRCVHWCSNWSSDLYFGFDGADGASVAAVSAGSGDDVVQLTLTTM